MPRVVTSPYTLLTLVALFWAGNTVVGRAVNEDLPPFGLAFWRSFGAFLILLPFGYSRVRDQWDIVVAHWRILTLLGFLGMTGFSAFVFVGLQYTDAVNGSLIQGTLTINIILVSLVLLGALITLRQTVGVVVALAGLIVIVVRGDVDTLVNLRLNIGDPLVYMGVVCHALFSVLLQRRPQALDLIAFMTVAFFVGSVLTLPLHLWEMANGQFMPMNFTAVWASAFVALFPSVLAQIFWADAIRQVGATTAGYFIYLTPVFGALMAIVLLGETFAWFHLAGIVLIFGGIYVATTAPARGH